MSPRSYLIWLPVVMVAVLLPLSIFYTYYNQRVIDYNHDLQNHAETTRSNVSELFWGTIQAIDLGLRGYALIPEQRFLDPMTVALSAKDSVFNIIEQDLSSQGFDMAYFHSFTDSLNSYVAFVEQMKQHLDSGNNEQFLTMLQKDKGYPLWIEYVDFARRVDDFEDQIMIEAESRHDEAMNNLYLLQFALLLVLVPTLLLYVHHFRKSLKVSDDLVQANSTNAALIKQKNEELEAKVKERTDALLMQMDIISAQRSGLQSANDSKDKIFSIISHDLRGPLSNLQNTIVALRNNILTPEESAFVLDKLETSFEKTNELLNSLLIWSKSQLSGIALDKKKFDLSQTVNELLELFHESYKAKRIFIENSCADNLQMMGSEEMIEMVLRNLISNAIKFTPPGGKISINAQSKNGLAMVQITDNGIGMKRAAIDNILQKGIPISTPGTNKEKGTGMGLLLVKEFVKLHNGSFDILSSEGNGTTFRISIPMQ